MAVDHLPLSLDDVLQLQSVALDRRGDLPSGSGIYFVLYGSPGRQMLYSLVQLGGTPLEGGGSYDGQVAASLGPRWYGNGGAYDTGDGILTKESYPALAGYRGDATTMRVTIGCHTTPCALKTNGANNAGSIFASLFGATVTINDPTVPKVDRVYPTGLAAGSVQLQEGQSSRYCAS